MRGRVVLVGCLVLVLVLGLALLPVSAHAVSGQLTQLAGLDGCWSETGNVNAGAGRCRDGEAIEDPLDVDVSPDGRNVYVAALRAVLVFSRNPSSGALTQLAGTAGCIEDQGYAGDCVEGRGVNGVRGVEVSPDGMHVYVASFDDDAVAAFRRDPASGALTQLAGAAGCVQLNAAEGCADGKALNQLRGVSISADGRSVYAASQFDEAVVVLSRNPATGVLTQLADPNGCVSDTGQSDSLDPATAGECIDGRAIGDPFWTAVTPDGKNVYLASDDDFIPVFSRDASTGALTQLPGTDGCVSETAAQGCADGTGLRDPTTVEVSADNRHVYVASRASESVSAFTRNLGSGALSQLASPQACINDDGDEGCSPGRALGDAWGVALAPDGQHLYVAADDGNAVVALQRNSSSGALTQLAGTAGCVQDEADPNDHGCTRGNGLFDANQVATSPDCRSVYVVSENDDAVAVFSREAAACPSQDGGIPPPAEEPPFAEEPAAVEPEPEEEEQDPDEEPRAEAAGETKTGDQGGELPFTGLGLLLVGGAGLASLCAGALLRRAARR